MSHNRRILFVVFVAAIIIAAHQIPGRTGDMLMSEFRNSLHLAGFAVLGIALSIGLRKLSVGQRLITALLIGVLIACLSEAGQAMTGYRFDLSDLLRDTAGLGIGLAASELWRSSYSRTLRNLGMVGAASGLLAPVFFWLSGLIAAASDPGLIAAASWWAKHSIVPLGAELVIVEASDVVIKLDEGAYSGARIFIRKTDWSNYQTLIIEGLASTSVPYATLRLDDRARATAYDERLNKKLELSSEPRQVRIPLSKIKIEANARAFDSASIHGAYLFASDTVLGSEIRFSKIRLE